MRIHMVSPPSAGLLSLMDQFQERDHVVSHSDQVPPDADLYFFCTGHEAMKHLTHGLVILDLRNDPGMESAGWLPYADLCLLRSASDQAALIEVQSCEPERVYVVPDADGLLELVDKAGDDRLPSAEISESSLPDFLPGKPGTEIAMADPQRQSESAIARSAPNIAALSARLEVAERQADVMLRDYQVQSKVPLAGPLVAWLRRNLTSHLREPYLDPTLEQQVALNRDLVKALREISALLAGLERRLSQPDEKRDDD